MVSGKENKDLDYSLMTLDELIASSNARLVYKADSSKAFSSVVIDSRNAKNNSLFIPLRGEKQDGHIYIESALKNGAEVFVVDFDYLEENENQIVSLCKKYNVSCIAVKNNLKALQDVAAYYLAKFPNLYKVGITGSSGKTTTKEILSSIYSQKYNTVATKGNLNSETGLPLSVFEVRPEHEAGIFELGMNRRGEIAEITKILLPNAAIITNIGTAHIGILGTRQAIAEEKKEIFSCFNDESLGFVPECEFTEFLKDVPHGSIFTVPYEGSSLVERVEDAGISGSKIFYKGNEILFPLPGKYNVKNALLCIALAEKNGFSAKEIKSGLEAVRPLFGRSQVARGFVTYFLDCYNANPDSMKSAIEFCDSINTEYSKHYILASMLELGAESEYEHKKIIGDALKSDADNLYFFGDGICSAFENVKISSSKKIYRFKTNQFDALKNRLKENLCKDDFVLLKGSRSMELERLESVLKEGEV
ncbi:MULTISPECIES: UDP-N-acetylmuramoyl-tripeptide--D-alanyl-D-alanine ligase [unclassified Treponema]|uniref:UDP-N-acetylmuramoyl-tripeptide--D-alanyl-D- alanine ligase n=1 Tax=unclassified Treponema TaxID=2638727 RepID=UPI0020A2E8D8|nr:MULTISPECIES: UDP-N-acetylmuramoyl-tripeptide--D-alanyl-D-alanine ligase [unclassified Treponema]UTC65888.1 UDP-N-acetylmuramoyl-tripeptide--D-alanyl-D-alanine ligase [Treponema sp. OMZ 789]UTC68616.1 UDP-N-acetylmuramoyl-tripeptide--D-alanyl-D-alanine ligase [Treponema sp. OMZ 790]UTC71346.1 UDP-N-acetylmuramoyl-tripeptide--D-alanyl-D-alanine ligase [Treponema sp. OMZ 791]